MSDGSDKQAGGFGLKKIGAILVALVLAFFAKDTRMLKELIGGSGGSGNGSVAESTDSGSNSSNSTSSKGQSKPSSGNSGQTPSPKSDGKSFAAPSESVLKSGRDRIVQAYNRRENKVHVTGAGEIVHILSDDNEGSRHQRFLIEINRDITLKVAHNIDLAPRAPVEKGDLIYFKGDYEYNDKGGVMHWTHHDPKGWHEDGWLQLDGKRYE